MRALLKKVASTVVIGLALTLSAVFTVNAAEVRPAYRIGPEDVLQISVWKEEGLDKEVLVQPDGRISFPLAGSIQALGKTPAQLQEEIRGRIQRLIPEAVVTVAVTKVSGYSIFVIGQVKEPGQFTLGRFVDVIQALTLAGGLTPYANEGKIQINRRNADNNKQETFKFNYSRFKSGRGLGDNRILQSGDVVVVP